MGWALSEVISLTDFHEDLKKEKHRWRKIAKVALIVFLFAVFLSFVGYEIWQAVLSYQNPMWNSTSYRAGSLNYPGFLHSLQPKSFFVDHFLDRSQPSWFVLL